MVFVTEESSSDGGGTESPFEPKVDPITKIANKIEKQKADCAAKGGRWDEATSSCILPTPTPSKPLVAPEVLRTEQDRLSGITIPGQGKYQLPDPNNPGGPAINVTAEEFAAAGGTPGRTFLGLSPDEVSQVAASDIAQRQDPAGTAPAGTQVAAQREMTRKIALAQNVGQIDMATAMQMEEQGLNVKEFLAAGGQKAASSAAGFAATGAAAGLASSVVAGGTIAPATVAAGAGIGAIGGAIKGFYDGVTNNIKDQRKDLVTVKTKELKQRKTAIMNYISAANANPAAAEDYKLAMNIELSLVRRDYNTLVKESENNLEFWGGDATPQIADYNVFFESVEPSLIIRMEQAILKPDPTRAYLTPEEEE